MRLPNTDAGLGFELKRVGQVSQHFSVDIVHKNMTPLAKLPSFDRLSQPMLVS